ncbi:VPLPA-CTERM sorting domain-containing protein [Thiohalobacter thiocyanaticus]|uniref:VPLPA-CTERM sorting domain-containing protein n=1 Tax=Thiohalobacter thiocyanaticus TaxID=585455 RepID=A0A426QFL5_9GAMM|nr:VPLPA-CTERM sorting domain-containing protein [Thiohalobacter thiocyanaticus]RRQ20541.1 VPLPA-CTERM sorting domain-containing protein [Thiohalobacter thiocyanaticus]
MKLHVSKLTLGVTAALFASYAGASTTSYVLNESNVLPDGSPYLGVDITERAEAEGTFDFSVKTLDGLNLSGDNPGIQEFGFNVEPAMTTSTTGDGVELAYEPLQFSDLPGGWSVQTDKNMSEFGRFDVRLKGTGDNRTDELNFSLAGTSAELIGSTFAAHVAGIEGDHESGFFGGGELQQGNGDEVAPPEAVPLPAAAWLFGSGLLGMVGVARRKSNSTRSDV